MWRKEELKTQGVAEISTSSAKSTAATGGAAKEFSEASAKEKSTRTGACIGEGIKIRGEITGSEDLIVEGEVEGNLELGISSLTVGLKGVVKGGIAAREVVVKGRVEGPILGSERVQVGRTGEVVGDVTTARVAIEEGGVIRGKIEAGGRNEKVAAPSAAAARVERVYEEGAVELAPQTSAE